ncbi:MAG: sulfite exporter TauE/SafE family protein [Thermoprotei archaeon]
MLDVITVMLISLFAGFLGALTGLGGGAIVIPVLTLLGVPLKYAIANSMITIIATSSGSAAAYVREKLTNIKVAMYLEIFTVSGAITGAIITLLIPSKYLYFFFAAFLLTSFYGIRKKTHSNVHENMIQDKFSKWLQLEGSYYDENLKKEINYKIIKAYLGGPAMMIAGLAAGMLGIGAGAFKVSIHELILRMPWSTVLE